MTSTQKNQNQLDDSWLNEAQMNNGQLTLKTIQNKITKLKPQMAMALPKHMDAERMARIALTELRQNPKLMECDPDSLMKCLMVSAQLGLEPGLLGHVYFIPFKREATIMIGYKGMIDLARRSGQIASISAHAVYEGDDLEIEFGIDEKLKHTPTMGERGKMIAVYAVAKLVGGGHQVDFMNLADVEKARKSSKAGGTGPWVNYYEEMARKTVIRRLFKYLPVSVELQKSINLDEAGDAGKQVDVINNDFIDIDMETGEILDDKKPDEKSQASSLVDKIK